MRTKVKKLTSVILAVVMMLGILTIAPLTVSAATYGDFEYTIENNSTCTITKYNGSAANVTIPSTIYGYKVCKVGDWAFSKNLNLKNITLPNSITCIDWAAFHDCTKLEHINIPNSITYIGGGAFEDCAKLEHITIPNSVTYIGDCAFYGCTSLDNIVIPGGAELSAQTTGSTFAECTNLKSVVIENGVTTIVQAIFENCVNLENVTIPNTVTEIYPLAFIGCTKLKSITIPKSVKTIVKSAGKTMGYYRDNDNNYIKIADFTIKGYKGTAAEEYAKENGFKFIALDVSEPTSVSLNKTSLTLDVSKSYTLTKTVSPSNAVTSYTWRSSNTSVATVDGNGKVTAKASGTATITVKTSNGKTATCKVTVNLPAPQITGLSNTTGGIKISWNKVDGAYGYRLYYKPASGGWKRFKDTTATSFTDSGVSPNRTETYTIRCIDKNGNTISGFNSNGWSKKYTPAAPTIFELENTSGGIKISWNKIAGVYGYRLYYKTSSGGWKRFKDTTATSFTDSGVVPNKTETYTIRCIDKNGNTISSFNSNGWSKKYTPVAPTISKLENTSGGIKISWNKIAGVYGYRLYYKTASGGWKRFKDTTATSFTDSGVSPNRTETYTIRCIDKNGNTVSGFYSRGWSKKYTPVAPTITRRSNTSKGVSVTWNKIAGVYGYRLYRKYDGGSWTKVKDTTSTSFTDSGAKKGKKVTYTVRCIDRKGKTVSGFNSKGWSITRK
nr:leucine-rich repeat protein [uncultured Ruminococcus sp.]